MAKGKDDYNLTDITDIAMSGAITVIAAIVALLIYKIAKALRLTDGIFGDDENNNQNSDTNFGEGPISNGEFFDGPIW